MDIGTIFSTILFIGPGFFIRGIEDEFFPNSNRFDNNEQHLVKAFGDSFFILLFNLFIIKKFTNYNFYMLSYLVTKFDSIKFFIGYVILTFLTCLIYAAFIKRFTNYLWRFIKNIYKNSKLQKYIKNINIYKFFKLDVVETSLPTIWDSIFNDNENNLLGKILTIEKDGNIISCGYIGEKPRINTDLKELILKDTHNIKSYMLDKDFKKDYIDTIEFEYYDFESGTLLKCYKLVDNAFVKYKDAKKEKKLQTNE